jgi:hypothetical protein
MTRYYIPKLHFDSLPPTSASDVNHGFIVGGLWCNINTKEVFICIDNTINNAIWHNILEYINLSGTPSFDYQTSINRSITQRGAFMTPQIFMQDNIIDYDITIPKNALSIGPLTISSNVTVATSGSWAII